MSGAACLQWPWPFQNCSELTRLNHGGDRKNKRALLNGKPAPVKPMRDTELCSGPGRLCHALAIDLAINGTNSCVSEELHLFEGEVSAEISDACGK